MVFIREEFINEIIDHASSGRPEEVCGVIAGVNGRAVKLYRGINVDENKRIRYSMDPKELLKFLREIDDKGWDLLAIYHSHPHTQAYPSATDVALAFYPDSHYVIASLMNSDDPVVRAFRIESGQITEVEIATEDPNGQ